MWDWWSGESRFTPSQQEGKWLFSRKRGKRGIWLVLGGSEEASKEDEGVVVVWMGL
jgi:hypothetical protein